MCAKEKVIRYLLSLNREYVNGNVRVYVSDSTYNNHPIKGIDSVELLESLLVLESEGLLQLRFAGGKKILTNGVEIFLSQSFIHYFDIKKQKRKSNRKEFLKELRAWITLIIAIAGFVLSIYSLNVNSNGNMDNQEQQTIEFIE